MFNKLKIVSSYYSLSFYSVSLSSTAPQCHVLIHLPEKGQKAQAVHRIQTVNLPERRSGFCGGVAKKKNDLRVCHHIEKIPREVSDKQKCGPLLS